MRHTHNNIIKCHYSNLKFQLFEYDLKCTTYNAQRAMLYNCNFRWL